MVIQLLSGSHYGASGSIASYSGCAPAFVFELCDGVRAGPQGLPFRHQSVTTVLKGSR